MDINAISLGYTTERPFISTTVKSSTVQAVTEAQENSTRLTGIRQR